MCRSEKILCDDDDDDDDGGGGGAGDRHVYISLCTRGIRIYVWCTSVKHTYLITL